MRAAGGPGLLDSEKSPGACPQRAARAPRLAHGWAPRRLSARRGGGGRVSARLSLLDPTALGAHDAAPGASE